ncbi:hypothetical protein BH11ARM2_BH11ARM2_31840 [soil metagenome]
MAQSESEKTARAFGAPAYERIASDLQSRIEGGEMGEGGMLPGRRTLAAEYKVSLPTIERAVASLVSGGVLRTDPRRGTFVQRRVTISIRRPGAATTLGVMAPLRIPATAEDATHNGSYAIVGAFERTLSRAGSRSCFFNLWHPATDGGNDRFSAVAGYEALVAQGVSVVVAVNALRQADLEPIRRAAAAGPVPLIVVNDEKVNPPLMAVHYDHADAAHQAATHLLDAGCTRLLFFSARASTWGEQRWQGVRRAARDAGLPERCLIDGTNRQSVETDAPIFDATQGGLSFARRLFEEQPSLLEAGELGVIAANDQMGWGFIEAASERGREMGRDYLIVGFDDMPESRELGLSSMRPPLEALGTEAAELAIQASRDAVSARRVCLHSELVARRSSSFIEQPSARFKRKTHGEEGESKR